MSDAFDKAKESYALRVRELDEATVAVEAATIDVYNEFLTLKNVSVEKICEIVVRGKPYVGVFRIVKVRGETALRFFNYKFDGDVSTKALDLTFGGLPRLSWDAAGITSVQLCGVPECVSLAPTPEQEKIIAESLSVLAEACNWLGGKAFEDEEFNRRYLYSKYAWSLARKFDICDGFVELVCAKVAHAYRYDKVQLCMFGGFRPNILLSTIRTRCAEVVTTQGIIKVPLAGLMRYTRWDKVMVREDLSEGEEIDGIVVDANMLCWAGKVVTIKRVDSEFRRYVVVEDASLYWTEDMFDASYSIDGGAVNG